MFTTPTKRVTKETACCRPVLPYTHYVESEEIELCFLPAFAHDADAGYYEVEVKGPARFGRRCEQQRVSFWRRTGDLPPGTYRIRVRWTPDCSCSDDKKWTEWSAPLVLTVHANDKAAAVEQLKVVDHRQSLILDRGVNGVATITDPWILPPGCPEEEPVRWFRTPCYDGAGTLVNEEADYYRDPLSYYLECIQQLYHRNARFITWHDVIDGRSTGDGLDVILQFDLDAGPRSMARIYEALAGLKVRGTIMVHREAHDWYNYRIEEVCLDLLVDAERNGWAIGYHNNSLGNVQRLGRVGDYSAEILNAAAERFRSDVATLRRWFDIRTFTHHGGIVINKHTPVPTDIGLTCADRPFNPSLWDSIQGSFSDGGFLARPMTLRQRVRSLTKGRFFFRNHPVKYGNYSPPFDVPPLVAEDGARGGVEVGSELREQVDKAVDKQRMWLRLRDKHRLHQRLSHASIEKPISSRFKSFAEVGITIGQFRNRRRDSFLRQYPWVLGDPRVFWWRMLHTYSVAQGEVLNVGALPPERRDENTAFLCAEVKVLEMDIDAGRKPDIICDVTEAPQDWNGRFAAVLLLGLPCFPSPSRAVQACGRLTAPGGVGMFGFAADTHPLRGALWRPADRPLWRLEREPLKNIALRAQLWSFDREGVHALFHLWGEVSVEFFSHYWFVLARKNS